MSVTRLRAFALAGGGGGLSGSVVEVLVDRLAAPGGSLLGDVLQAALAVGVGAAVGGGILGVLLGDRLARGWRGRQAFDPLVMACAGVCGGVAGGVLAHVFP